MALLQQVLVDRPPNRMGIELTLLGDFGLVCDGCAESPPETAQRLLALLALWDQPLARGFIAGTLWLDASDQQAGASLRSALWRLRKARADLVVARPGHRLALRTRRFRSTSTGSWPRPSSCVQMRLSTALPRSSSRRTCCPRGPTSGSASSASGCARSAWPRSNILPTGAWPTATSSAPSAPGRPPYAAARSARAATGCSCGPTSPTATSARPSASTTSTGDCWPTASACVRPCTSKTSWRRSATVTGSITAGRPSESQLASSSA